MIFLDEILERVKDSDLEHFKEKLTKMEEEQEFRLHSQNLESIDDLAKRKYLNQIQDIETNVESMYIDATALEDKPTEQIEVGEKSSDTLYQEFLKKLKG
jgi:hypothetical protein